MTRSDGSVLRLLSAGAARAVAQSAGAALARDGVEVAGDYGAAGAMRDRLLAGEAADVVILTGEQVARLAAAGHVVAGTIASLGRVSTGIAVRSGDPDPGVAEAPGLAAALRRAQAIFFPDPARATAGIHFMDVLARIGVAAEVASALRPYPSGALAMAAMAQAGEPVVMGCTQVTEIRYTPGVTLVGVLPAGLGLVTEYVAAVTCRSRVPALAADFVAALAGNATLALRRAGGFDP